MKITADSSKQLTKEQMLEVSKRELLERSNQYASKEQHIVNQFKTKDDLYQVTYNELGQVNSLKDMVKRARAEEKQAKQDLVTAQEHYVIIETKLRESLVAFIELADYYENKRSYNPEVQDTLDEFVEALRSILGDDNNG
jgi:hypothetical protein